MTVETATITTTPFRAISQRAGAFLRGVAERIAETSDLARCAHEAERLSALSDAELARRGIDREQIIQHAFRRYMY